jgi:hypothetical protein
VKRQLGTDNATLTSSERRYLDSDLVSADDDRAMTPEGSDIDDDIEACSDDDIDIHHSPQASLEEPKTHKATQIRVLKECISENLEDLLRYTALIRQYSKTKTSTRADYYSPQASDDSDSGDNDSDHGSGGSEKPSLRLQSFRHTLYTFCGENSDQSDTLIHPSRILRIAYMHQ